MMFQPTMPEDAAGVTDDFVNRVANLPEELKHVQEEIAAKDRKIDPLIDNIRRNDEKINLWIRTNSGMVKNPKEEYLRSLITDCYDKAERLQDEKIALAAMSVKTFDRHLLALDKQIKALQDKGELSVGDEMPSLLTQVVPRPVPRAESTVRPAIQVPTSTSTVQSAIPRHVNPQAPAQRMIPVQTGPSHPVSAPSTPAGSLLNPQRQQRESSAGPSKRPRNGNLPVNSSGLARHSSIGPGTPKAGTPGAARAVSAQPRGIQKKDQLGRKVVPHKISGMQRKPKPGKSGLSRVKRTGNKSSPTSTNESELSDADSESPNEEDEARTPNEKGTDLDGDHSMGGDDDDNKYCTCQSASYGNMVACDNQECPIEWFHWTCVGLKSEPDGVWFCPDCTKEMAKQKT